ncbi:hypothetical protein [Pseudofrankia sp. DC12]|uniref:hypothetical protein n=1 Tax=Pseudofrankia sp. DC12 TaxID=683315 RepID=UPI0005F84B9C|nr:hypothetical protein [Pseudofrankia sp. DC12]
MHRIRWAGGNLATPDHEDPDGERTLGALGGESAPCIAILDAWQRHRADLDVLLLTSRGSVDPLRLPATGGPGGWMATVPAAMAMPAPPMARPPLPPHIPAMPASFVPGSPTRARARSGGFYYAGGGHGPGGQPRDDTLTGLLRLPGTLPDRLVATVVAAWAQRIADDDPRVAESLPALHAALYGRALAAARSWLGGGPTFDVRLAASPAVVRRPDGIIAAELPFSWLRDVWARGFATLAGHFCLTAQPGPAGDWTFTTIAPDCGPPEQLTLRTP